jgi:hypothetical protein
MQMWAGSRNGAKGEEGQALHCSSTLLLLTPPPHCSPHSSYRPLVQTGTLPEGSCLSLRYARHWPLIHFSSLLTHSFSHYIKMSPAIYTPPTHTQGKRVLLKPYCPHPSCRIETGIGIDLDWRLIAQEGIGIGLDRD